MCMEWQKVKTQSDLGLYCLLKPIFPNTEIFYCIQDFDWLTHLCSIVAGWITRLVAGWILVGWLVVLGLTAL